MVLTKQWPLQNLYTHFWHSSTSIHNVNSHHMVEILEALTLWLITSSFFPERYILPGQNSKQQMVWTESSTTCLDCLDNLITWCPRPAARLPFKICNLLKPTSLVSFAESYRRICQIGVLFDVVRGNRIFLISDLLPEKIKRQNLKLIFIFI